MAIFLKLAQHLLSETLQYCKIQAIDPLLSICIIGTTQEEMTKMITLNNRDELVEFLYGANSTEPETLVGVARIGGELLAEALASDVTGYIEYFFPMGDEGEFIEVARNGEVVRDGLYY